MEEGVLLGEVPIFSHSTPGPLQAPLLQGSSDISPPHSTANHVAQVLTLSPDAMDVGQPLPMGELVMLPSSVQQQKVTSTGQAEVRI